MKNYTLIKYKVTFGFKQSFTPIIIGLTFLLFLYSCDDDPDYPYNALNGRTTAVFNPEKEYGIVVDIDGNQYKTIQIGDQVWMAENLRTTHYRNGKEIPNITDEEWANQTSGAYCN